jgi:ABC-type dipeptide transport system, periplasmic component
MERLHPYVKTLKDALDQGKIGRREFLRTAVLLGTSATLASKWAYCVAPARASETLPSGGTLRIGMSVFPLKSPHQGEVVTASNVIRGVCEYLTRTDQDNVTRPYLLSSWEASDDLKTWTLKLRDDVTWRNGRKFTADDVVWNLKHVLDVSVGSSMIGLMKSYMMNDDGTELWDASAIEKKDDFTVQLNLRRPQLAVPEHLFNHPMAIIDPDENGVFEIGANGTGPFELVELEPGRRAVLRASKTYWGKPAYLDSVEYIDLGEDPAATMNALRSGQIDGAMSIDSALFPVYRQIPDLTIYEVTTAETATVRGRVDQKPFDDPRVRKALKLAVDQEEIVNLAMGGLGAAGEHHHVSPVHPEYSPLPPFKRDVAAARALLAEAGYPDGFSAELTVNQEPAWLMRAAQGMVNHWAEAGINVTLQPLPPALYNDKWKEFPFAFTPWRHRPLGVIMLELAYRSGGPQNESGYSNAEFDALLTEAGGTLAIDRRREIVARLQQILQEDGPIVQPAWRKLYSVYHTKVRGYRMHPTSYIFAEQLAVEQA